MGSAPFVASLVWVLGLGVGANAPLHLPKTTPSAWNLTPPSGLVADVAPNPTRVDRDPVVLTVLEWGGLGISSLGVVVAGVGQHRGETIAGVALAVGGMSLGVASLGLRSSYPCITTEEQWRQRRRRAVGLVSAGSAFLATGLALLIATAAEAPAFDDDTGDEKLSAGRMGGVLGGGAAVVLGTLMLAPGIRFATHLGRRPEPTLAVRVGLGQLGLSVRF